MEFKSAFTSYFGEHLINLNVHQFCHLGDTKERFGSLHNVSAVRSENLYQVFLKSFVSGTRHITKQGLKNVYLKYTQHGACIPAIRYENKETARSQDNYVFTHNYKMFKIVRTNVAMNTVNVQEMKMCPFSYTTKNGVTFNWNDVGVFRGPPTLLSHHTRLHADEILGKVVVTPQYGVCASTELLLDGYF